MSYRMERSAVRNLESETNWNACGKDSRFRVFDEVSEHCSTLRSA